MTNPDRLSGLDASFLALEEGGAHMHVGSCMVFEGEAPSHADFVAQLDTPPLRRATSGPLRVRELLTGIGRTSK